MFWLARDYQTKEAVRVLTDDELGANGVIQDRRGLHIAHVDSQGDGTYLISIRNSAWPPEFIPKLVIEPISESEYRTYQEFNLFKEKS